MTTDESSKRTYGRAMDAATGHYPMRPRRDPAQITRDAIRALRRENDDAPLGRAIGKSFR